VNELTVDTKITLDIVSGAIGGAVRLMSAVEETYDDGGLLIGMPMNGSAVYPLSREMSIVMRYARGSTMYAQPVKYIERVKKGILLYAKVIKIGEPTRSQKRDCYRVGCVIRVTASCCGGEKKLNVTGRMADFSEGGMMLLSDNHFEKDDHISLAFNLGRPETVGGTALLTADAEEPEKRAFKYRTAIRFDDEDGAQKQRFYKFILETQKEERRQTRG